MNLVGSYVRIAESFSFTVVAGRKAPRQAITDIKPALETSQLAEPLSGQAGGSVSSRSTSGVGFTVVADTSRGGNSVLK